MSHLSPEQLRRYARSELAPAEANACAAHLDGCAVCRGLLAADQNLGALLKLNDAPIGPPEGALARVLERAETLTPQLRELRRRRFSYATLALAALAVAVFGLAFTLHVRGLERGQRPFASDLEYATMRHLDVLDRLGTDPWLMDDHETTFAARRELDAATP